jgi:hypothetical protein
MQFLTLLSLALSVGLATGQAKTYSKGKEGVSRLSIDNGVIKQQFIIEFADAAGLRKRAGPDGNVGPFPLIQLFVRLQVIPLSSIWRFSTGRFVPVESMLPHDSISPQMCSRASRCISKIPSSSRTCGPSETSRMFGLCKSALAPHLDVLESAHWLKGFLGRSQSSTSRELLPRQRGLRTRTRVYWNCTQKESRAPVPRWPS